MLKKNSSNSPTEAGQHKQAETGRNPPAKTTENGGSVSSVGGSGDNGGGGNSGNGSSADHVDAISQIFAEFQIAYHNQFHKAYPDQGDLDIAKKYWLSHLQTYSPAAIVAAAKHIINHQEYLPSIARMVQTCEQGVNLFGLPDVRRAYQEACSAPSPKREFQWSHPAVYHAGQAAGWHLLAGEPEGVALPTFEYHYAHYCRQVMAGEELHINPAKPLPEQTSAKLEPKELKARLKQLRKELNL